MAQVDTAKIRVAELTAGDEQAVAAFYRKVWGGDAAAEDGTARAVAPMVDCPFPAAMPAPVAVVFAGDQIVGYLGSIATELWDGSKSASAHWLKGFMVLEEYRNGPIGYLLLKQLMKQISIGAVMTVAPAARRLFEAVGFRDVGTVPNYVTVIRPTNVLRAIDVERLGMDSLPHLVKAGLRLAKWPPIAWLAGSAARVGMALLDGANRVRGNGLSARTHSSPPAAAEIDALWQAMSRQLAIAPNRSGAYIAWRYAGDRYQFICVRRQGGTLAALAVVRRPERIDDPRLAGLRVGLIVDLVLDPSDTAAARRALLAARGWGRRADCDAVLLTISHRGTSRIMTGLGYARIPGNVHFLLRVPAGTLEAPQGLEHSWLTRGDAWGDDI
jgi:hypothetical protein